MSHLMDKVSYLRGLMEGMKLDTATNEGLLLSKIVDVLDSMAVDIADMADAQEELNDFVEAIGEDLTELEEVFLEEEDEEDDFDELDDDEDDEDDDEIEDDFGCDGDCEGCSGCDEDEDYDGEIFVECMCPECKGTFYVKEDELDDSAFHICPRCGARIHVVPDFEADIPVAALADGEDRDE